MRNPTRSQCHKNELPGFLPGQLPTEIRSHKTPPVRSCPIFPELRQHLLRAKEYAPDGAEYVHTRYSHDANILTTLEKIVTKAGLVPWPKLMQKMRATRETELIALYPAKDVTGWLGNIPAVASKHYAMTMQASFDRAVTDGAKIAGVTCGVLSKVPLKVPPTLQDKGVLNDDTKKADAGNPVNNWGCLASALSVLPLSYPARTDPTAENTVLGGSGDGTTTETTTQPAAAMFADCVRQHLNADQLHELMRELAGVVAE